MANKKDLIDRVQQELDLTGNAASKTVNTVLAALQDLTLEDGHLGLTRYGVFDVKERGERKGRNMQTGEPMTIPASKTIVFHPAKEFKTRAND